MADPAVSRESNLLNQRKLQLEVQEQKFWWLKIVAPALTIVLTAVSLFFGWKHTRKAELQETEQRRIATAQVEQAQRGQDMQFQKQMWLDQQRLQQTEQQLQLSQIEAEANRAQVENSHRDEIFAQSVAGLTSSAPAQRLGAITAMESFALTGGRTGERAILALAGALETEPETIQQEAIFRSFERVGLRAIPELIVSNRRAQARLARACGRLVGIDLNMHYKYPASGNPAEIDQHKEDEIERNALFEAVARMSYAQSPLEELTNPSFIQTGFWLQYFPEAHREIFQNEKNANWTFPASSVSGARESSLKELESATHFMTATSIAIQRLIAQNSGRLRGLSFDHAYLIAPDFRHLDLQGAGFRNAMLPSADLRYADLSGADFTGADLDGANFSHARLRGTILTAANLNDTKPSPIDGTDGGTTYTYFAGVFEKEEFKRFEGIDLSRSDWWQAHSISPMLATYAKSRFPRHISP